MMARNKVQMPTDEALKKAEVALSELAAKKAETATDKIWSTLGDKIKAARASGHSWDDIAGAISAAGIVVSASTLRSLAPKTAVKPRKPRVKQTTEGTSAADGGNQT